MKKLLTVLLSITASICSAFAFSACDLNDLFGKTDNGGKTEQDNNKEQGGNSDKDNTSKDKEDTYYSVTVIGNDNLFYEQLKDKYKAGEEVEVKLHVITDVGLFVFVNDKRVTQAYYDGDYWGYKFTMPEEDIEVYITSDAYHGVEICDFSRPFFWVNYLKNDEVVKIKCERRYNGVSPDILPEVIYTTDKTDIENICAVFNCKLKPVPNPQIDGGYYITYTFYTANDLQYELPISNGYALSISFSTCDFFEIVDFILPEI